MKSGCLLTTFIGGVKTRSECSLARFAGLKYGTEVDINTVNNFSVLPYQRQEGFLVVIRITRCWFVCMEGWKTLFEDSPHGAPGATLAFEDRRGGR